MFTRSMSLYCVIFADVIRRQGANILTACNYCTHIFGYMGARQSRYRVHGGCTVGECAIRVGMVTMGFFVIKMYVNCNNINYNAT